MFPIRWNDIFRKKDGTFATMEEIGGGGGGSSFTPDYENEVLNIGDSNDYHYFIPMSKRYIGDGDTGYEIKTAADSSASAAKIDLYQIIVKNGEVLDSNYITTLVHNSTHEYSDENISVEYVGSTWIVSSSKDFVDLSTGDAVQFPVSWSYNTNVDYKWYMSTGE